MRQARIIVVVGALLLVSALLPIAGAHLAQNSANAGSPTSFGFGGTADADPCRHASSDLPTIEIYAPPGVTTTATSGPGAVTLPPIDPGPPPTAELVSSCTPNNGVSGTYVGSTTYGAVDCLNATQLNPPDGSCDGLVLEHGGAQTGIARLMFQSAKAALMTGSAQDWGATGIIVCDLEFIGGDGVADEEHLDNGGPLGNVPDGTWDDGGIGGACHMSTYGAGAPNTNPPNANNNAPTDCTGTVYAQDWLMGNDVPLVAGCDSADFAGESILHGILSCLYQPLLPDVECLQKEGAQALQYRLGDTFIGCVPDSKAGAPDTFILGKGDGHGTNDGSGVPVPGYAADCTNGDVVVFITTLVSTNPFNGEHVEGSEDNFGLINGDSPDSSGSGDHVVYHPAGGWIDHFY